MPRQGCEEAALYGFPLDWVPRDGADQRPLGADPRLGEQMRLRMGNGDTAVSLAAAGLVHNALILSGERRYRDWIAEYVGAWRERAAANGGVLPDNVAPDGTVGGLLEGRWYGSRLGQRWCRDTRKNAGPRWSQPWGGRPRTTIPAESMQNFAIWTGHYLSITCLPTASRP